MQHPHRQTTARPRGRCLAALVALGLAAWALAGCGDDATEPFPDEFGLTVVVRTPDGEPVSGLRASLSPALDERFVLWPYGKCPSTTSMDLPPGVELDYRIYDLEGYLVRHIVREYAHQFVVWSGRDDYGQPVHDGVYRYVGEWLDEGVEQRREGHLVFITGTPDHFTAAVTDQDGRFTVRDPTYVPAFYDLEPITVATYPEGHEEELVIRPRVRLTLLADDGRYQAVEADVVQKPQSLRVVWEPKSP